MVREINIQNKQIVCFGEVLWDVLPNISLPGGAPMNVAIRLSSFGVKTYIISRIGKDTLGYRIEDYIGEMGVDKTLLQKDDQLETGKVNVKLDSDGIASYDIVYPSAWDNIELTNKAIDVCKQADMLVFGSLACRDAVSKETLTELLKMSKYKVFDVNLRPPHYNIDWVLELMSIADLVKLNNEELVEITKAVGQSFDSIHEAFHFLSNYIGINNMCVTKGAKGAIWFTNGHVYEHDGYQVDIQDTVGAGDSFLATLLFEQLKGIKPEDCILKASAVGALVATKDGANANITKDEINRLILNRMKI